MGTLSDGSKVMERERKKEQLQGACEKGKIAASEKSPPGEKKERYAKPMTGVGSRTYHKWGSEGTKKRPLCVEKPRLKCQPTQTIGRRIP